MRVVYLIVVCLFSCFTLSANRVETDYLEKFSEMIKKAENYNFDYVSGDIKGVVAIARDEMYMSQNGKLEIYEKDSVRYSHNIKRRKVDIDGIKRGENSGTSLFNWLDYIGDFKVVSKNKTADGGVEYFIERGSEKINIIFSFGGELRNISYSSDVFSKIDVRIDNFKINGKSPSEYFTFNPEKRKDLEITDYR